MSADNVVRNLRSLWRADSIIADIQLRHLLFRSGLSAFAGLIASFGLIMLEVAGYLALVQLWTPIWAASALAIANFALALVLALIAARRKVSRELDLARDVHAAALQALQADARSLQADVVAFKNALAHPLDSILPGLIAPLAAVLLKSLKRTKAPSGGG